MPEREKFSLPIVPHEWVAGVDCCGCLIVESRGAVSDLTCNECGAIVRTLPAGEVAGGLLRLAINQGGASLRCRNCGELNVLFGFDSVDAFVCRHCRRGGARPPRVQ